MFKLNINRTLASITGLVLLFIFLMLFIGKANEKASAPVATQAITYYFNGTSASQANNPDHWSTTNNGRACGGDQVPCQVTLSSGTISNYLSGKSAQDVMDDINVSKRAL